MLKREGGDAVWGFLVRSVGLDRDVALNANADVALVPASNVKLMTCAAALLVSHVGPGYRFETSARLEGEGEERCLCVTPTGDPTLSSEELKKLVKRAISRASGPGAGAGAGAGKVRVKLTGKPWLDEGPHPTWEVGDLREPWAAPPSRAVLDGNIFPRATPASSSSADRGAQGGGGHDHPPSPRSYFTARVAQLADENVGDEDDSHGEDKGDDAVARHLSQPVASMARRALEFSDNLCAEQLLRAASGGRDSGRWLTSWSAVYVNKHCASSSPSPSPVPRRVRLVDGSGLSRHNLAPPRAFVALLLAALEGARREEEEEIFFGKRSESKPCRLLLDSLPLAGHTGTLSDRLVGTPAEGTVRAKTGTMTGVAALSGIFQPPPAHRTGSTAQSNLGTVVFSIIANNAVGHGGGGAASGERNRLRAVIDEIVTLITLAR